MRYRCGSDPALLWLWLWLAAVVLIQPLAWEHTSATGAAQKKKKGIGKDKGCYLMIKGSVQEEDITLINICALGDH